MGPWSEKRLHSKPGRRTCAHVYVSASTDHSMRNAAIVSSVISCSSATSSSGSSSRFATPGQSRPSLRATCSSFVSPIGPVWRTEESWELSILNFWCLREMAFEALDTQGKQLSSERLVVCQWRFLSGLASGHVLDSNPSPTFHCLAVVHREPFSLRRRRGRRPLGAGPHVPGGAVRARAVGAAALRRLLLLRARGDPLPHVVQCQQGFSFT